MGNSKNNKACKKTPKRRTFWDRKKRRTSSEQKENVPKNVKSRAAKPEPNGGIAMSKQLLLKKNNVRTQRRSLSKPERICPNGKPLPSLSELEKMYEDSDDDDQHAKTPTQKPTCATSTPKQQHISEINLLSPTKINEITERIMGSIQKQNLPDPSELMEVTSLLREKSPPPPPIIPPKKRKKPEVPYIVGCKDRPKVVKKPNTNFCKGFDDYGVEPSSDPEEQIPTKRAKKSRIPKYSKSIFNAHSDEIAERLAKDDAEGLSDASSDSNKTIEYSPTLYHISLPHSFSPLPSTSTDSETFKKNDELFNESLKEMNISKESTLETKEDDLPMIKLSIPDKKDDFVITEELTPQEKDDFLIIEELIPQKKDDFPITEELTPQEKDDFLIIEELIPQKKDDFSITEELTLQKKDESQVTNLLKPKESGELLIIEQSTWKKKGDDVQIIDIPYPTIVIEDDFETSVGNQHTRNTIDTNVIEIIEPQESEVVNQEEETHEIPNDDDCMIVPSSETIQNVNNFDLNEQIVIDDDYSIINKQLDSSKPEITDIDNIIAENMSLIAKWKGFETKLKNINNTVVEVPTTYKNNTVVPQTTVTTSTTVQTTIKPSSTVQDCVTPNSTLQASVTTNSTQASVTPSITLQTTSNPSSTLQDNDSNINLNRNTPAHSRNNRRQPTPVHNTQRAHSFHNILELFSQYTRIPNLVGLGNRMADIMSDVNHRRQRPTSNRIEIPHHSENHVMPVSTSSSTVTLTPSGTSVPSRNIGDCPICLEPLNSSNGIASTICGHVFCLQCIQASVKTNGKKCPTCRKALKGAGGGYHQLYL